MSAVGGKADIAIALRNIHYAACRWLSDLVGLEIFSTRRTVPVAASVGHINDVSLSLAVAPDR